MVRDSAGFEYGCGEAGLDSEDFGTKIMLESSLKTPKIMHDMFVAMSNEVDNKEEETSKLRVVGFLFSSSLFFCNVYGND